MRVWTKLAQEGAHVIPAGADVFAQLVECNFLRECSVSHLLWLSKMLVMKIVEPPYIRVAIQSHLISELQFRHVLLHGTMTQLSGPALCNQEQTTTTLLALAPEHLCIRECIVCILIHALIITVSPAL